jgi:hypothetical protein
MGKDNLKKFEIADPQAQISSYLKEYSKYELGEKGYSFYQVKNLKPVFAFDYISLDGEELCFNYGDYTKHDFIGLLEGLKKVSEHTYDTLHQTKAFRFHKIDFDGKGVSITRKMFKEKLTNFPDKLSDDEIPNLWQFDLQYIQKARVAGFLYKGIFYLVWYDRDHLIYSD